MIESTCSPMANLSVFCSFLSLDKLIFLEYQISTSDYYSFFFKIDPKISPKDAPESLEPYLESASFSS